MVKLDFPPEEQMFIDAQIMQEVLLKRKTGKFMTLEEFQKRLRDE